MENLFSTYFAVFEKTMRRKLWWGFLNETRFWCLLKMDCGFYNCLMPELAFDACNLEMSKYFENTRCDAISIESSQSKRLHKMLSWAWIHFSQHIDYNKEFWNKNNLIFILISMLCCNQYGTKNEFKLSPSRKARGNLSNAKWVFFGYLLGIAMTTECSTLWNTRVSLIFVSILKFFTSETRGRSSHVCHIFNQTL